MKTKETAEQFVKRMLTGLTAKTLPQYPDSTFYVNDKDELIVEIENGAAWCRYQGFWSVLEFEYMLKYNDAQLLIGRILEQTLKVKGVTALPTIASIEALLEQTLKTKIIQPEQLGNTKLKTMKKQTNTHNMPTTKEQIKSKKKMAEIYAVMVKKLNRLISVMPQEVSGDTSDLISTDLTTLNNDIKGIREYLVIKKTSNENMIAICNERIEELKKMPENENA